MALVFKITLLALVGLATAASLNSRDQRLAKITGASDVAGIQKAFKDVFQSTDIDQVLQKISDVTKQEDPVAFLEWTLDMTAQNSLQESSKVFLASTTQDMTFLQYLETVAAGLPHDLKDFYVQITRQAAKTTIQDAFGVLVEYLGVNDLFEMVQNVMKYTNHPDPIEIHETEFTATGTKTLQESFGLLMEITETPTLLDAYAAIQKATNEDIVDVIAVIGTFKGDNWDQKQAHLENVSGGSDFLSALRDLPGKVGETSALAALKKIANQ